MKTHTHKIKKMKRVIIFLSFLAFFLQNKAQVISSYPTYNGNTTGVFAPVIVPNGAGFANRKFPLDSFARKSELSTKQNTLIPGSNITIVGNTISATGGGGTVYGVNTLDSVLKSSNWTDTTILFQRPNVVSNEPLLRFGTDTKSYFRDSANDGSYTQFKLGEWKPRGWNGNILTTPVQRVSLFDMQTLKYDPLEPENTIVDILRFGEHGVPGQSMFRLAFENNYYKLREWHVAHKRKNVGGESRHMYLISHEERPFSYMQLLASSLVFRDDSTNVERFNIGNSATFYTADKFSISPYGAGGPANSVPRPSDLSINLADDAIVSFQNTPTVTTGLVNTPGYNFLTNHNTSQFKVADNIGNLLHAVRGQPFAVNTNGLNLRSSTSNVLSMFSDNSNDASISISSTGGNNGNNYGTIGNSQAYIGFDTRGIAPLRFFTNSGSSSVMAMHNSGNVSIGAPSINSDNNPQSIFTVETTNKASIPFPIMTQSQRLSITGITNGMHVFQSDGVSGVYVVKSGAWIFAY